MDCLPLQMQDSADSSKQNPASNLNVVFLEWRDKDKASELEDSVAGPVSFKTICFAYNLLIAQLSEA